MEDIKITKDLVFTLQDLMRPVSTEHNPTLRDVLTACVNSDIGIDLVEILQCPHIPTYYEEAESKPFETNDDIEHLELAWGCEKDEFGTGMGWNFHGVGKAGELPEDADQMGFSEEDKRKWVNEGTRQGYAVEFSPMYKLADFKIKIADKMVFTTWDEGGKSYTHDIKKVTPRITLCEYLYEIFWELSFIGGPEERDERLEDLQGQAEAISNGTAELVDCDIDGLKNRVIQSGEGI